MGKNLTSPTIEEQSNDDIQSSKEKKSNFRPKAKLIVDHEFTKSKGIKVYKIENDIISDLFPKHHFKERLLKLQEKAENLYIQTQLKINKDLIFAGDGEPFDVDLCDKVDPTEQELKELVELTNGLRQSIKVGLQLLGAPNTKSGIRSRENLANIFFRIGALCVLTGIHEYPDANSGRNMRRARNKPNTIQHVVKESRKARVIRAISEIRSKNKMISNNKASEILFKHWHTYELLANDEPVKPRTIRSYLKNLDTE